MARDNGHALIGGSSLSRAMECPPSVRLTEHYDDESSIYAKEGTYAHLLLEKKVKRRYGIPFEESNEELEYYSEEMEETTDIALNFISEVYEKLVEEGKHPFIASEVLVDFSDVVPEGSGSSDVVIVFALAWNDLWFVIMFTNSDAKSTVERSRDFAIIDPRPDNRGAPVEASPESRDCLNMFPPILCKASGFSNFDNTI